MISLSPCGVITGSVSLVLVVIPSDCSTPRSNIGRCRYNAISKRGKILAYEDLRGWIAALERAGELKTIRTEVDPVLEITEITDRVSKEPSLPSAARRACPAFPEHQGPPRIAGPDQPVRLRSPHEPGPGSGLPSTRWPTASALSWT